MLLRLDLNSGLKQSCCISLLSTYRWAAPCMAKTFLPSESQFCLPYSWQRESRSESESPESISLLQNIYWEQLERFLSSSIQAMSKKRARKGRVLAKDPTATWHHLYSFIFSLTISKGCQFQYPKSCYGTGRFCAIEFQLIYVGIFLTSERSMIPHFLKHGLHLASLQSTGQGERLTLG